MKAISAKSTHGYRFDADRSYDACELDYIERQIKEFGGILLPGLYHGKRRIKANLILSDWVISSDEADLIEAIGAKTLQNKRPPDIKSRYGLDVRIEIAPVAVKKSSDSLTLKIERTDEFGQGAKKYIDSRSLIKRILPSERPVLNILLAVLFAPLWLGMYISKQIPSEVNVFILLGLFLIGPPLGSAVIAGTNASFGVGMLMFYCWFLIVFAFFLEGLT